MDRFSISRRRLMAGTAALAAFRASGARAQETRSSLASPIGWADEIPGEGFRIGHGFCCENTWFNPGWWHTGEDWYGIDRETGDAVVYAVADGEVVYVGYDYPGRVIVVQHQPELFSVYGHLDFDSVVDQGIRVMTGDAIGAVLLQVGGRAPSHLHFEMRTFLTTAAVNGNAPRYGVNCGVNCPPGPGYWPIDDAEHPSVLGWLNPTHAKAAFADSSRATVVVQAWADGTTVDVYEDPDLDATPVGEIELTAGNEFALLGVEAGGPATEETSAEAYRLWYRIDGPEGAGWVQAAVPSDRETGSDGSPSGIELPFLVT